MKNNTPYYLFDKDLFLNMLRKYQEYGKVYFPVKANDEREIISAIKDSNAAFEVDSIEHIQSLINEYNISVDNILYSFLIRKEEDIRLALSLGVRNFVIDSFDEYKKIISQSDKAKFVVRINVLEMLNQKVLPAQNKWGLNLSEAKQIINELRSRSTYVCGISFYIPAEIEHQQSFEIILKSLISNFKELDVDFINIGGGISLEQLDAFLPLLQDVKSAINAEDILIEPGRHLLNPCIDMVVSVTAIKLVNSNRLVFIDAGIYSGLIDCIVKNKKYRLEDKKINVDSVCSPAYICGSSSDISDTLGAYELRNDLSVGDLLYIKDCGAYSYVMQTNFYAKSKIKTFVEERC